MKQFLNFLLNIFFPRICLGCKKEGSWLCDDCFSTIEIQHFQYCPFCKEKVRIFQGKCQGKCNKHLKKKLDGLYFAAPYNQPLVKKLITKFKYEPFIKELTFSLSLIIIAHLKLSLEDKLNEIFQNAVFIPIPLSQDRFRSRGFNQAKEIGKILSNVFKVPFLTKTLFKIKKTKPQVGLSLEEREKNVKGIFLVENSDLIKNKKIFLIDDVFTTGSTMEEAAKTLKKSSAKEVWGIVVTREE